MTTAELQTAWDRQGTWSATADRLKRGISRARSLVLGCIVFAAFAEVLAAAFLGMGGGAQAAVAGRVLAGAGAVALAVASFVRSRNLGPERERDWVRARSASEALKAAVYMYLTRTGEYAPGSAPGALSRTVERICAQVEDLELHAAFVTPPKREPPPPLELADYVRVRLEGQINGYYRRQAADLARRLGRFRRAEVALTATAAILGALAALVEGTSIAAWVAVLTTVSGAVAAHVEASRFEHLIVTYRGTARRLESLRDAWRDDLSTRAASPEEAAAFVKRCEDAISVENEAWMAEWAHP